MTARVQYLAKNNIEYLSNNCLHCTVVQIVLLSKSSILRDENLQYVVKMAQLINVKVTIMRQTINKTLYGVNMYIQCIALHIVLNNSKSQ